MKALNKIRLGTAAVPLMALCVLAAGCQPGEDAARQPVKTSGVSSEFSAGADTEGQLIDPLAAGTKGETETTPPVSREKDHATAAASDETQKAPQPEPRPEPADAKTETADFNRGRPALFGIHIGDSRASVADKFGKPRNEYRMEDEQNPLTVYEYDGFSVGFTSAGKTEFVTVQSDQADPGLEGIRIGDTADQAAKSLGRPDTDTGYVITYKTKAETLKLDVDPKTRVIRSIKLFASS
jgi:hypothetical protein